MVTLALTHYVNRPFMINECIIYSGAEPLVPIPFPVKVRAGAGYHETFLDAHSRMHTSSEVLSGGHNATFKILGKESIRLASLFFSNPADEGIEVSVNNITADIIEKTPNRSMSEMPVYKATFISPITLRKGNVYTAIFSTRHGHRIRTSYWQGKATLADNNGENRVSLENGYWYFLVGLRFTLLKD